MKINLNGVILNITQNEHNSKFYWEPRCMLLNLCNVERNGIWYKSGISFTKKGNKDYIQISNLILTGENNIIEYHEKGLYKELPISNIKKQLIEILMNEHILNYKWYKFRKKIYDRKNTIFVFAFSITLAVIYYIGNEYYNNSWANYIGNNSIIQALFILLNIFSIGSIFYPFTIQKTLSENDIKILCNEEMKKYDKERESNNRSKERARL